MDKDFARKYSVEIPKLDFGENFEQFEIDSSFFAAFENAPVDEGQILVDVKINRLKRHLNAEFHFKGTVTLNCDRCLEPYPFELDFRQEVVYSFDEELEFDTDEVVLVTEDDPQINFATDFFDFISLQIPLRRVPSEDVHVCPEAVLRMLGLLETEEEEVDEEEDIDPRWAALKKLKKDN